MHEIVWKYMRMYKISWTCTIFMFWKFSKSWIINVWVDYEN